MIAAVAERRRGSAAALYSRWFDVDVQVEDVVRVPRALDAGEASVFLGAIGGLHPIRTPPGEKDLRPRRARRGRGAGNRAGSIPRAHPRWSRSGPAETARSRRQSRRGSGPPGAGPEHRIPRASMERVCPQVPRDGAPGAHGERQPGAPADLPHVRPPLAKTRSEVSPTFSTGAAEGV